MLGKLIEYLNREEPSGPRFTTAEEAVTFVRDSGGEIWDALSPAENRAVAEAIKAGDLDCEIGSWTDFGHIILKRPRSKRGNG